jgi:iron complex transport system substrate-binding protein
LNPIRIASLLPSATEIVAALGGEDSLCGVSHECDYPSGVRALPKLTRSNIPDGLTSLEIDTLVREQLAEEGSLYHVDETLLRDLQADVVITQALCDVCAVNYRTVSRIVGSLPDKPSLVSLEPGCMADILADIVTVSQAIGAEARGRELVESLRGRMLSLSSKTKGALRPRVLALEWTEPPYFGGHWVPEQIEAAGGESLFGRAKERSRAISKDAVRAADPDVLLLMPCGADLKKAKELAQEVLLSDLAGLSAIERGNFFVLDANAYFSRPGPRVFLGAEILGHILHPNLVSWPDEISELDSLCRVSEI